MRVYRFGEYPITKPLSLPAIHSIRHELAEYCGKSWSVVLRYQPERFLPIYWPSVSLYRMSLVRWARQVGISIILAVWIFFFCACVVLCKMKPSNINVVNGTSGSTVNTHFWYCFLCRVASVTKSRDTQHPRIPIFPIRLLKIRDSCQCHCLRLSIWTL